MKISVLSRLFPFFLPLFDISSAGAVPVIDLVPHKAVYDISLDASGGRNSVRSASGEMTYEFSGSACEGYSTRTHILTLLQGDAGSAQMSDLRSTTFESAKGDELHFVTSSSDGKEKQETEGVAERDEEGNLEIIISKPKLIKHKFNGPILFPVAHSLEILRAAQAQKTIFASDFFDGSEGGAKVYATTAVIGGESKQTLPKDHPAAVEKLAAAARYPVSVSFFERDGKSTGEQAALYNLQAELSSQGVTTKMRLDYSEFSLNAKMKSLELLPVKSCKL